MFKLNSARNLDKRPRGPWTATVSKFWFAACLAMTLSSPALACLISPDYVPPTLEDQISWSHVAFVGTVIAFRSDTGKILDPDVDQRDAWVITAILSIDHEIRGVAGQEVYEVPQRHDSCSTPFQLGRRYLVIDNWPEGFARPLTAEQISAWRSLPWRERQ